MSIEQGGDNPRHALELAQNTTHDILHNNLKAVANKINTQGAQMIIQKGWKNAGMANGESITNSLANMANSLDHLGLKLNTANKTLTFPSGPQITGIQDIRLDFPQAGGAINGTYRITVTDDTGTYTIDATRGFDQQRPMGFYIGNQQISGLLEGYNKPDENGLRQERDALLSETTVLTTKAKTHAEAILRELGYEREWGTYKDASFLGASETEASIAKVCSEFLAHGDQNNTNLSVFANKLADSVHRGNIDESVLAQVSNIQELAAQFRGHDRRLGQINQTMDDIQASDTHHGQKTQNGINKQETSPFDYNTTDVSDNNQLAKLVPEQAMQEPHEIHGSVVPGQTHQPSKIPTGAPSKDSNNAIIIGPNAQVSGPVHQYGGGGNKQRMNIGGVSNH